MMVPDINIGWDWRNFLTERIVVNINISHGSRNEILLHFLWDFRDEPFVWKTVAFLTTFDFTLILLQKIDMVINEHLAKVAHCITMTICSMHVLCDIICINMIFLGRRILLVVKRLRDLKVSWSLGPCEFLWNINTLKSLLVGCSGVIWFNFKYFLKINERIVVCLFSLTLMFLFILV